MTPIASKVHHSWSDNKGIPPDIVAAVASGVQNDGFRPSLSNKNCGSNDKVCFITTPSFTAKTLTKH